MKLCVLSGIKSSLTYSMLYSS